MKKTWAVHPLLFALFPVLFVYSHNMEHLALVDLWPSVGIVLGVLLLLFFLFALVLRDLRRAALQASLLFLLFFSCAPFTTLLSSAIGFSLTPQQRLWVLAAWGLLYAVLSALLLRVDRGLENATKILNAMAIGLVTIQLLTIGFAEVRGRAAGQERVHSSSIPLPQVASPPADSPPDIYYVILDGYARADVLKEIYGYDNSEFLAFLAEKGFYVAQESQANYAQTALSLASSLNMDYLDGAAEGIRPEEQDRQPLEDLIEEGAAIRFLREQGYVIVAFPSAYTPTHLDNVDVSLGSRRVLNELELGLLLGSPLPWLWHGQTSFGPYASHVDLIQDAFAKLPDAAGLPAPHFVFAHIVAPHPPFVFDSRGNQRPLDRSFNLEDGSFLLRSITVEDYRQQYVEQLMYVNTQVREMLDALLARSSRPAVVILQADHGPGSLLDWNDPQKTYFRERLTILNAYLLPGGGSAELYAEISPVNTFRLILNRYLGTDLDLLEDRSYFSTWEHPYEFIDVTGEVRAGEPPR